MDFRNSVLLIPPELPLLMSQSREALFTPLNDWDNPSQLLFSYLVFYVAFADI